MKRVIRIDRQGNLKRVNSQVLATVLGTRDLDSKVALIQALIPVGLKAVAEALETEVVALVGQRYSRTGGQPDLVRWGRPAN